MRRSFTGSVLLALLSLSIGCGGAGASNAPSSTANRASNDNASAPVQAACPYTPADVASAPPAGPIGMRLRAQVPAGFIRPVGLPALVHECGAAVVFSEVPPSLDANERQDFLTGLVQGVLESAARSGTVCRQVSDDAWTCDGDALSNLVRVRQGDVIGVVQTQGAFSPETAQAIVSSVTSEPGAPWQPLASLRLHLDPPEGLGVHRLTSPPVIRYALDPNAATGGDAVVVWTFIPYAQSNNHQDGSAWDDREIGAAIGERANSQLGVVALGQDTSDVAQLRTTELGNDIDLVMNASRDGQPVAVYMGFYRELAGVFIVFGVAPDGQRDQWVPRFRAHTRTFRIVED